MEGKYPSLEGENIIVIGAGGIGGAVVGDFLRQGSNVYALDKKPLKELEKVWDDYYGKFEKGILEVYQADVTDHEELKKTIREIGKKTKPKGIRSMIYTAGIGESIDVRDFEDGFPEKLFELNVCGFIYAIREIAPYMKKGSSITAIGSLNASRSEPHMALYDSTKAALTQFARTAAVDLGPEIRVNVVAPGYIRTPQTTEELNNPKAKKTIVDNTILKRVGTPEDISAVVVALASDDFNYVTGSVIPVDGGLALAQYPPIEKQKNM
ncbi:MAG: SDR family oxidoreductase [Candidatus Aenigmarchaeota archaeon]|nr:SDR family oxidoreductase [Candidatus Aenigmarchaeota archaeon]